MPDSSAPQITEFVNIANAAKQLADEIHSAPTSQFGCKDAQITRQQANLRSLVCNKLLLANLLAQVGARYMSEPSVANRDKLATLLARIENQTEDDTRYYKHLPFNENFMYLRGKRILDRATTHAADVLSVHSPERPAMRLLNCIMEDIEICVANIADLRALYRAEPPLHRDSDKTLTSACAYLYSAAHLISIRHDLQDCDADDGDLKMSKEIKDVRESLNRLPKPHRQSDWISQIYLGRAKRLFNETIAQASSWGMKDGRSPGKLGFPWSSVARAM